MINNFSEINDNQFYVKNFFNSSHFNNINDMRYTFVTQSFSTQIKLFYTPSY